MVTVVDTVSLTLRRADRSTAVAWISAQSSGMILGPFGGSALTTPELAFRLPGLLVPIHADAVAIIPRFNQHVNLSSGDAIPTTPPVQTSRPPI